MCLGPYLTNKWPIFVKRGEKGCAKWHANWPDTESTHRLVWGKCRWKGCTLPYIRYDTKSADFIITELDFGFGKFYLIISYLVNKIKTFYIFNVCKYAQIILEPRKRSLVARKKNKRVLCFDPKFARAFWYKTSKRRAALCQPLRIPHIFPGHTSI